MFMLGLLLANIFFWALTYQSDSYDAIGNIV